MDWEGCRQSSESTAKVKIDANGERHEVTYLKTFAKFRLLLIYDTKPKVDLIGFLKVRRHAHDLREGLLGMV